MPSAGEEEVLELGDAGAWSAWLEANHAQTAAVWLKIAKRGSPVATLTQVEAIEGALCFGWIDGQLARHDEHFYRQRFTPRKPRSSWSELNRERALRLIAAGRMRPAGLAELQAAQHDGRIEAAYAPQSRATVPEDLQAALDEHPAAREFFKTLAAGERYRFLYRLANTRDSGRRARRIADYVELLGRHETLGRG